MRGRIDTLQAASSPSLGKVAPSPRPDNPRSSPQTPDVHQQPQGPAEARRVVRAPCAHCCHTLDAMALETASVQRAGAQASQGTAPAVPLLVVLEMWAAAVMIVALEGNRTTCGLRV